MQAVGFDMDYTLSQYKPETFEKLAHDLTVEKLVSVFGYPEVPAPPPPTTPRLAIPHSVQQIPCSLPDTSRKSAASYAHARHVGLLRTVRILGQTSQVPCKNHMPAHMWTDRQTD